MPPIADYASVLAVLNTLPRPTPELPVGVTDDAVQRFERRFGITIPADVLAWLRCTNGPFVNTQSLLGIETDHYGMDEAYALYPHWPALRWLPIASDGCGNLYAIDLGCRYGATQPVFFVDHEVSDEVPSHLVASGFRVFLPLFVGKESRRTVWPFDRELTLHLDPGLAACSGAPMPWDV